MRSLVAPKYGDPSIYEIVEKPHVQIQKQSQVLVHVHGASINGHDVIMASGKSKMIQVVPLPYPIGLDFSGTIVSVGAEVHDWKKGDQVYGFTFAGGAASTLLLVDTKKPHALCKIPSGLDMMQAASLPAVAITADIALSRADKFFSADGGLTGKTVFISAALSGVGSMALQIAKHKWNCHTITSASTAKIPQLEAYLGTGVVDKIVDYTKVDVVKDVGKGQVDFVFDTTGLAAEYIPMIKKGGLCLSVARLPPGSALKNEDPDAPRQGRIACIGQNIMDGMDAAFRMWAQKMHGVTYVYQKTDPTSQDLHSVRELVSEGRLKAVVGRTVAFDNVEEVRDACMAVYKGKGGVGKVVIKIGS